LKSGENVIGMTMEEIKYKDLSPWVKVGIWGGWLSIAGFIYGLYLGLTA